MAKIWTQDKERFMCPVCGNEEIELGQKYCQICGEALERKEKARVEQVLEKILEEMDCEVSKQKELCEDITDTPGWRLYKKTVQIMKDIVRGHMVDKDINDLTKWIPVEERLPKLGEPVWATVKHSEWISDYDTDWLPEEKKTYHPESYGVYKAEYIGGGIWQYSDDYNEWIYCDAMEKEERNLANVYDTVTAWQPLPEPYQPEE